MASMGFAWVSPELEVSLKPGIFSQNVPPPAPPPPPLGLDGGGSVRFRETHYATQGLEN